MKIRFHLILITLLAFGCNAQNSVTTNEIIRTENNLFGVKSKNGKLIIDSIYKRIEVIYNHQKLMLPPNEKKRLPQQLEYYLVSNSNNQKGLFDKNGKMVFGFMDCQNIILDEHTQTVVVNVKEKPNTPPRSYLYNVKGDLLFDTSYENIGFISNSDLITLVVEDGRNDEYYLYNPFTKNKIGPIDHFNIYNEYSSSFGMKASDFEKYKKLNIVTIRREVDNDYIWGMIDSKGNEILPIEYKNLSIITERHTNHPAFKRAVKPDGVEFILKGAHISKPSTSIYFDSNFDKYEFKTISIPKGEYRIEKM